VPAAATDIQPAASLVLPEEDILRLTAKAVAGLVMPAGKTDVIFFDDAMPGFGYRLRLGAGGKVLRSWVVQYRHAGATRRLLLGAAEVLGPDAARAMARKALGRVANGADPQAERSDRRARNRHTLKAVVDDFLAMKQREVRPRTYTELVRYLSGPYFKPLHTLPLDQITKKDIAARLVVIGRENGSIVAARARAQLSGLFTWALAHGLCEVNPVVGTLAPKGSQPRNRVLSDSELSAIWKACGDDDYGRIVRLLILAGCRRQEVGSIAWSEIDLGRGVWVLPAARSKNGRQHVLPFWAKHFVAGRSCTRRRGKAAPVPFLKNEAAKVLLLTPGDDRQRVVGERSLRASPMGAIIQI
jgi:hypothetical protein